MLIPDYINKRENIVKLILFTSIFALIFINIYKPFSSSNWYPVTDFVFFLYSSLIILTGVLVVVISRVILYFYSKKREVTYLKYALWIFLEILFMALFYTLFTLYVDSEREIVETFKSSLINTALVLLLPYSILWLYLGWRENALKLEKLEKGEEKRKGKYEKIPLFDEKGVLRISINREELLYIESNDNYVTIYYLNGEEIKKFLLRNRMNVVEKQLLERDILRCHRTYLVNMERCKILRKEGGRFLIELDTAKKLELPVSKSYQKRISERFLT